MGENHPERVEKSQGNNHSAFEPTDTTLVESTRGTSVAPSSSHSTPSAILVPITRVQKLEAQMATLLHHIQLWMQKSIIEAEDRVEKKIVM